MSAIFKREFRSYFTTPLGYIFLAAFYLFEGIFFVTIYSSGSTEVPMVVLAMQTVLIFVLPFLTMRTISEDRRQKVDQALLTAPISVTAVVMGKFFAALSVIAIGFAPTLLFEIIISFYVTLNWLIYIYALIGILLLSATLVSIGLFISSLTESSALSAVLTVVANLIVMLLNSFASMTGISFVEKAASYIAFMDRFDNFANGLLSIPDIVYFLSITVIFVFLTVRSVEKRRWA